MTIPEIKDTLQIGSETFNEVRKACGLSVVKNFNENHIRVMRSYMNKAGIEKEYNSSIVEPEDENNETEDENNETELNDFEIPEEFDVVPVQERPKKTLRRNDMAMMSPAPAKLMTIQEGDLIKLLSKAYDTGYEKGKGSIEVTSFEKIENILNILVENKKVS